MTRRPLALAGLLALAVVFRAFICAFVALVLLSPPVSGGFIITFKQVGNNVEADGAGTINTAGLHFDGLANLILDPRVNASPAVVALGPIPASGVLGQYSGIVGPTSFGPGNTFFASTSTGPRVAINGSGSTTGNVPVIFLPNGYVSGQALTDSATWNNTTISGLGLTPGDYKWTWGSGGNTDFFEVVIPAAAVPEPSSLILAGTAIGIIGFRAGVRRRRAAAAAA
jgi:hypothetical protein